jgi:hypothetical protein
MSIDHCTARDAYKAGWEQRDAELRPQLELLRAALLHVIDGVGGADAIGWNPECPTCVMARDLVQN